MAAAVKPELFDIYLPRPATLVDKRTLTEHETFFRFEMDNKTELAYQPGQFLEISIPGTGEAATQVQEPPRGVLRQLEKGFLQLDRVIDRVRSQHQVAIEEIDIIPAHSLE